MDTYYEYVVIVKLSPETARTLNKYAGSDGLRIEGPTISNSWELNANTDLHRQINSRVFVVKAKPKSSAIVVFNGKTEDIVFPEDKEFIVVSNC